MLDTIPSITGTFWVFGFPTQPDRRDEIPNTRPLFCSSPYEPWYRSSAPRDVLIGVNGISMFRITKCQQSCDPLAQCHSLLSCQAQNRRRTRYKSLPPCPPSCRLTAGKRGFVHSHPWSICRKPSKARLRASSHSIGERSTQGSGFAAWSPSANIRDWWSHL